MKKYVLTDEYDIVCGVKVYRIRALINFGDVKARSLGGYIQSEKNLSQDGDALVYGNAYVYGGAKVYDNARVCDHARVWGFAKVYGNACVSDGAWVLDKARICDHAQVNGRTSICGYALVCGHAQISERAIVESYSIVCRYAQVVGEVVIGYGKHLSGHIKVGTPLEPENPKIALRRAEINAEIKRQAIKLLPSCQYLYELPHLVYSQIIMDNASRNTQYRVSEKRIRDIIHTMPELR